MATTYLSHRDIFSPSTIDVSSSLGSSADATTAARKPNALGTKVTSVLSSSYADHEIRDALRLLDDRGLQNDQDTRRNLKTNAQKDVIDCNAKIVDDFGAVAEVSCLWSRQRYHGHNPQARNMESPDTTNIS